MRGSRIGFISDLLSLLAAMKLSWLKLKIYEKRYSIFKGWFWALMLLATYIVCKGVIEGNSSLSKVLEVPQTMQQIICFKSV